MPNTIGSDKRVAAPCAVFKIDLKGRFVYIDDEVEELLGATLEELFGKSINEYISSQSRQLLDALLNCHNRYESFYDSLALDVKLQDSDYHRFDAVVTLNFIGGNPVNYQVILLPLKSIQPADVGNIERRFLDALTNEISEVSLNDVAELFCRAGGYAKADCYLPDKRGNLVSVASYPIMETGFAAPAYVELFAIEPKNRFSFISTDRALHDGFGDNRSEAVIFLHYKKAKLILNLQATADYQPGQTCLDDINLFVASWNERYAAYGTMYPNSEKFSLSGRIAAVQGVMLAIVNDNFDILYGNDPFTSMLTSREIDPSQSDMTRIYDQLCITDLRGQTVPFEKTPFARAIMGEKMASMIVRIADIDASIALVGSPFELDESRYFVYTMYKLPGYGARNSREAEMLQSVAHDLKAPIITIDAFARRLKANHSGELTEDGQFAVNCLAENVTILQDMLTGLDELARHATSEEPVSAISAKDILSELIHQMTALYPDKSHAVTMSDDIGFVDAPQKAFTTVCRNLLDNAFKYSNATANPEITIAYTKSDTGHRFSIADNGPGISTIYHKKVFEPFFRAPDMMDIPGTGIGLAIARDVVLSWGGEISIATKQSRGTKVSFTVPAMPKG